MAAFAASFQLRVASVESRLSDRVADVQRRGNASSVPRSDRRRSAGAHPVFSTRRCRGITNREQLAPSGNRDDAATASLPCGIALWPYASPGYLSGSKGTSILHTWRAWRIGARRRAGRRAEYEIEKYPRRSRLTVLSGSRASGLHPSGGSQADGVMRDPGGGMRDGIGCRTFPPLTPGTLSERRAGSATAAFMSIRNRRRSDKAPSTR
jgi:hypothetical protein